MEQLDMTSGATGDASSEAGLARVWASPGVSVRKRWLTGIGVALAEMCIGGERAAEVDLHALPGLTDGARDDIALFAESLCRFVVEVRPDDAAQFEALLSDTPRARIGAVSAEAKLRVLGRGGRVAIEVELRELEQAWAGPHPSTPAPAASAGESPIPSPVARSLSAQPRPMASRGPRHRRAPSQAHRVRPVPCR